MNLRIVMISAILCVSSGCSTMGRVSDTKDSYSSGNHASHVAHRDSEGKTVNKVLSIPFKAVGIVTAGLGLLLVEISTHHYTTKDYNTDDNDDHDTDVGLVLTGIGMAIGGGLLYELGNNIAEQ